MAGEVDPSVLVFVSSESYAASTGEKKGIQLQQSAFYFSFSSPHLSDTSLSDLLSMFPSLLLSSPHLPHISEV